MPKIPNLREGQRLQQRSPIEAVSARDERIRGEALTTLGTGIEQLGSGIVKRDRRLKAERERQKRLLADAEIKVFESDTKAASATIKEDVAEKLRLKEIQPYEADDILKGRLDKDRTDRLNSRKWVDPRSKRLGNAAGQNANTTVRNAFLPDIKKAHNKQIMLSANLVTENYVASIFKDPTTLVANRNAFEADLQTMPMAQGHKDNLRLVFDRKSVDAALNGYLEKNTNQGFRNAHNLVKEYSTSYKDTPTQTASQQRASAFATIRARQRQMFDDKWAVETRTRTHNKNRIADIEEFTYDNFSQQITLAMQQPSEELIAQELSRIDKEVKDPKYALSKTDRKGLHSRVEKIDNDSSNELMSNHLEEMTRIKSKMGFKLLRAKIIADRDKDLGLNENHYQSLITKLNTYKDSGSRWKDPEWRVRFQAARAGVKTRLGRGQGELVYLLGQSKKAHADAKATEAAGDARFISLVIFQGLSPEKAAKLAVDDSTLSPVSVGDIGNVPGLAVGEENNPEALKKAAMRWELEARKRGGEFGPPNWSKEGIKAMQRIIYYQKLNNDQQQGVRNLKLQNLKGK